MSKKIVGIVLLLLVGQFAFAQQTSKLTTKVVNWGVLGGLNALNNTKLEVSFLNAPWNNQSVISDIGFSGTLFMRVNLNRFFIQPEVAYQMSEEKFALGTSTGIGNNTAGFMQLKVRYYSANTGGYVGYNLVKSGPFTFNFYAGPTFKYHFKTSYKPQYDTNFEDYPHRFRINLTTGFSLSISAIFLDFRYELNKYSSEIDFNEISKLPISLQDIKIKKRENVLNFSCGLMF